MKVGCQYSKTSGAEFTLWAPYCSQVELKVYSDSRLYVLPMRPDKKKHYWRAVVADARPGTAYVFVLDHEKERPDPASHFQPQGVHGPSQIVDQQAFAWHDHTWHGIPLQDMILYEFHLGAFTPAGTFAAAIERLDDLKALGINTMEIMPVAAFPGKRNWGYDGVYPYSVQAAYGGPEGLKQFVDACHERGLAVVLDVVYNHLGPEGNYLRDFGPYFTTKYRTPWGEAINYDDAGSDEVRNFFIENALHWFQHYHIDGLRLDAVHTVTDFSAYPFLAELADRTAEFTRGQKHPRVLIAESDLNDARIIRPRSQDGYGLDGSWCDDFHHSLHALCTGEQQGYYQDFGSLAHLAKALTSGYVYDGQVSRYRGRRHGNSCLDRPVRQLVICDQNHDQVGNRLAGDRLSRLVDFETQKLAASALLLSPYVPLLFMGEEYGETAPFLYFVDHTDPALNQAVRQGRQEEFRAFAWQGPVPDPAAESTFMQSKLNWDLRTQDPHDHLWRFYQHLIRLRQTVPALRDPDRGRQKVYRLEQKQTLIIQRGWESATACLILNFNSETVSIPPGLVIGRCRKQLDSADSAWAGPGSLAPLTLEPGSVCVLSPRSAVLYTGKPDSKVKHDFPSV